MSNIFNSKSVLHIYNINNTNTIGYTINNNLQDQQGIIKLYEISSTPSKIEKLVSRIEKRYCHHLHTNIFYFYNKVIRYEHLNNIVKLAEEEGCDIKEIIHKRIDDKNLKKYDLYGFDEDGIHKATGTRYNIFGFNKNGIHKDTNKDKDKWGHTKSYYNVGGICSYFEIVLGNLLLDTSILNFDGEKFINAKLNYKDVSTIKLISYRTKTNTNYRDNRPKKLNGSPDYRYKSNISVTKNSTTVYNIVYSIKNSKEVVSMKNNTSPGLLSEEKLKKIIERYNVFLHALQNSETEYLYNELLLTKKKCQDRDKTEMYKLKLQKQKKLDIFNRLDIFKEQFTEEQSREFENLKQDIMDINNLMINKDIDFKNSFDEIYIKLNKQLVLAEKDLKKVKKDLNSENINDEINDLFQTLKKLD